MQYNKNVEEVLGNTGCACFTAEFYFEIDQKKKKCCKKYKKKGKYCGSCPNK